jgi:hypothetical protein
LPIRARRSASGREVRETNASKRQALRILLTQEKTAISYSLQQQNEV